MNVALIALDMDGTLLDANHVDIPPRNRAALQAAAAQGATVVLASGRTMYLLKEAIRTLGVVKYALVSNGAGVWDVEHETWLSHIGMPDAQWRGVLKVLQKYNVAREVYADGMAYLNHEDMLGAAKLGFSPEFAKNYVKQVTVVDDVAAAVTDMTIEKIHVFYVNPEIRDDLLAELADLGPMAIANAEPTNLEITALGANKGAALAFLCNQLGLAPEQVMAFGDGDNDLEMLGWAGQSYAMGNGSANAKAAAKHVTGTNRDAGVAQAVEAYLARG